MDGEEEEEDFPSHTPTQSLLPKMTTVRAAWVRRWMAGYAQPPELPLETLEERMRGDRAEEG
jgi:hypothetical protein